jgi:choline kinase
MTIRNSGNLISDAVVLMAGAGSRLRMGGATTAKPLIPILGRPLICYTLEAIARAGVENVYIVVGFEREAVTAQVRPLIPSGLNVHFVNNPDWEKQNGISVLAVAGRVRAPFLLTMCDHLFDDAVVDALVRESVRDEINLAIDRKLDSVFDLDDAMKVQTQKNRIVSIGKSLATYDSIDTGVFVCADILFDYLNQAMREGDCSLADGVRLAAADGKARAIDIEGAWWQDVDTPEMLRAAEKKLKSRIGHRIATADARSGG